MKDKLQIARTIRNLPYDLFWSFKMKRWIKLSLKCLFGKHHYFFHRDDCAWCNAKEAEQE